MSARVEMASAIPMKMSTRASMDVARNWGIGLLVLNVLVWAAGFAIGFRSSLTILMVISLGIAVLGLRRPIVALYGLGILCALDSVTRTYLLTGNLLRWNTLNYWLLLVILFAVPFLMRLHDVQTRLLQLLMLLLLLGIPFSTDRTEGVAYILDLITTLGILYYFVRALHRPADLYWLALLVSTSTMCASLVFYAQFNSLPTINPNAWAFLPLTGLFAVCLAFPVATQYKHGQLILGLLAAGDFVAVFLSSSRGNLLVALCCGIYLVFSMRGLSQRVLIFTTAILVGFMVATQFTDLEAYTLHRINRSFDSQVTLDSRTSGRSELVVGAWYILLDHPFGVGTGGFAQAWADLGNYHGQLSTVLVSQLKDAHSAWTKVLAENGPVGLLLLILYVFSFVWIGWRKRAEGLLALGVLTTGVLSTAFISTEFQGKGLWFLAIGVTSVLHRQEYLTYLRRAQEHGPSTSSVASNISWRN